MLIALALAAAACVADESTLTLTGRLVIETVPDDRTDGRTTLTHPALVLDRPICIAGSDPTGPQRRLSVEYAPPATAASVARLAGKRVEVRGVAYRTYTADQGPYPIAIGATHVAAAKKRASPRAASPAKAGGRLGKRV